MSGQDARAIASRILRGATLESWRASLAELVDAEGHAVDQVVVTYFQAPRSYTSEDLIEISCHGSPVVLRHAVERALAAGARLAEPGEVYAARLPPRADRPTAGRGGARSHRRHDASTRRALPPSKWEVRYRAASPR
ncbi:MAG: hypothetical protein WDO73_16060 [Ignavibacteriota bacterium]